MSAIYPFEKCCSHPNRPLSDHQAKVAMLMHDEAVNLGTRVPPFFAKLAKLIGFFHDNGKGTWYFQDGRLGKKKIQRELGNHASLSALLSFVSLKTAINQWCDDEAERDFYFIAAIMAIRRHHGNVKDFVDAFERLHEETESRQLEAIDLHGVGNYCRKVLSSVGVKNFEFCVPEAKEIRAYRRVLRKFASNGSTEKFVIAGLLFSLLVWADKIDAATGGQAPAINRLQLKPTYVDDYRQKVFGPPGSDLDKLRNEVYSTVENVLLASDQRLFTLTSPTGSAKTLAMFNAAIKLRASLSPDGNSSPPRIVYCLPFTSIIDQNYAVFADVLEKAGVKPTHDLMLKHHYLVSPNYVDLLENDFGYNVGQLLVSAWDSEIVVTTFIQLLNSIIGNRNKMMRKIARIPGSIILLDEVQAIPRKYWETIEKIITTYAEKFDCRFVLLTATRPLIIDRNSTVELLPQYKDVFGRFNRYDILPKCEQPIPFDDFKEQVANMIAEEPDKRHLVVMNTVQGSIELFKYLQTRLDDTFEDDQMIYLSTNITPRDQRRRIARIRKFDQPTLIVSTQVVEAGVDISVDIVHRDLAPLDSIIQSAGRCNRSNERPSRGKVYVWSIQKEDSGWRYSFIYDTLLLSITQKLLSSAKDGRIPETDILELSEAYFEAAKSMLPDCLVHEAIERLDFKKVDEQFQLIEDDGVTDSYFVISDDDAESSALWDAFQKTEEMDEPLRRRAALQEIKQEFFDRVLQIRLERGATPHEGIQMITSNLNLGDHYDRFVGFQGSSLAIF